MYIFRLKRVQRYEKNLNLQNIFLTVFQQIAHNLLVFTKKLAKMIFFS